MKQETLVARRMRVRGVVQGVGFRPFVFRLASAHGLTGWVLNEPAGVEIHVEGAEAALHNFARQLCERAPFAARIGAVDTISAPLAHFSEFSIRDSTQRGQISTPISPDLPICEDCVAELFDASNRRCGHPYISCAHCGPRYSIVTALPYDRLSTTMADWQMCDECAREYHEPRDRRFHAQPIACHHCGPHYRLLTDSAAVENSAAAIKAAAQMLRSGGIVAIKGVGGYHMACDAVNAQAVAMLRERKFRKEKPFALMAKDIETARQLVQLSPAAEVMLLSAARPIVLAPATRPLSNVAPDAGELGIMLPYAPLHYLLFAAGAPAVLVMTSANRASEPIAFQEVDAFERLDKIADAFLVGERAIARRIDDSVVRIGTMGPQILRRSRGYAPGAVTQIPLARPVLALGGDLKNTITLVVDGEAYTSQHIGDLEDASVGQAFKDTIRDFLGMYALDYGDVIIAHDLHPQYTSSGYAAELPAHERRGVQHHRAHIASVLAERGCFDLQVLGIAFDGTGYGDDGSIWGGEFFVGSIIEGLTRVAHLRPASLVGGDAAARQPVQAAVGFLDQLEGLSDVTAPPFCFPKLYLQARELMTNGIRTFQTTSAGRLFDTVAALLGFTRQITFEGQAAMWLEHLATRGAAQAMPPVMFRADELDFRATLQAVFDARLAGKQPADIARSFHRALAYGIADAATHICRLHGIDTVVLSGGVFQNDLLLRDLNEILAPASLRIWTNQAVPPNDGGLSLGQAAMMLQSESCAAFLR